MPEPFKGVEFNAPPPHLMQDAMAQISAMVSTLPPDADAAIVGLGTNKGVNAAFVAKVPGGFEVMAWVGKDWGSEITYGAGVQKVFKFGK